MSRVTISLVFTDVFHIQCQISNYSFEMQNLSEEKKMCAWRRGGSEEMTIRKTVKENQRTSEKSLKKYTFRIALYEVGGGREKGRLNKKLVNSKSWKFQFLHSP